MHLSYLSAISRMRIMSFWPDPGPRPPPTPRAPISPVPRPQGLQNTGPGPMMANNKFHITKFLNNGTRKWRLELKFPNWLAGPLSDCIFSILRLICRKLQRTSQTCSIQLQLILRMSFWLKIITMFSTKNRINVHNYIGPDVFNFWKVIFKPKEVWHRKFKT